MAPAKKGHASSDATSSTAKIRTPTRPFLSSSEHHLRYCIASQSLDNQFNSPCLFYSVTHISQRYSRSILW